MRLKHQQEQNNPTTFPGGAATMTERSLLMRSSAPSLAANLASARQAREEQTHSTEADVKPHKRSTKELELLLKGCGPMLRLRAVRAFAVLSVVRSFFVASLLIGLLLTIVSMPSLLWLLGPCGAARQLGVRGCGLGDSVAPLCE